MSSSLIGGEIFLLPSRPRECGEFKQLIMIVVVIEEIDGLD